MYKSLSELGLTGGVDFGSGEEGSGASSDADTAAAAAADACARREAIGAAISRAPSVDVASASLLVGMLGDTMYTAPATDGGGDSDADGQFVACDGGTRPPSRPPARPPSLPRTLTRRRGRHSRSLYSSSAALLCR